MAEDQRDLFVDLIGQLRALLVGGDDDGLRRLFPPAYADDEEREAGYQALAHQELLDKRLAALDLVETTAYESTLTEDQVTAWMNAINDLRLVLGTRLDVSEDMDAVALDDPRAPAYAVYVYLTHLLGEIVVALSG